MNSSIKIPWKKGEFKVAMPRGKTRKVSGYVAGNWGWDERTTPEGDKLYALTFTPAGLGLGLFDDKRSMLKAVEQIRDMLERLGHDFLTVDKKTLKRNGRLLRPIVQKYMTVQASTPEASVNLKTTNREQVMANTKDIKAKNPGIMEMPEGAWDRWSVKKLVAHFTTMGKKKGKPETARAIMNIERWNKNRDPALSAKARSVMNVLKKSSGWVQASVSVDRMIMASLGHGSTTSVEAAASGKLLKKLPSKTWDQHTSPRDLVDWDGKLAVVYPPFKGKAPGIGPNTDFDPKRLARRFVVSFVSSAASPTKGSPMKVSDARHMLGLTVNPFGTDGAHFTITKNGESIRGAFLNKSHTFWIPITSIKDLWPNEIDDFRKHLEASGWVDATDVPAKSSNWGPIKKQFGTKNIEDAHDNLSNDASNALFNIIAMMLHRENKQDTEENEQAAWNRIKKAPGMYALGRKGTSFKFITPTPKRSR